jgi:type II secretory pathway component PulJ
MKTPKTLKERLIEVLACMATFAIVLTLVMATLWAASVPQPTKHQEAEFEAEAFARLLAWLEKDHPTAEDLRMTKLLMEGDESPCQK